VNRQEAAKVLGVRPGAAWADVRRAYRSLIRSRHPDLAGIGSTADAARIIDAYSVLRAHRNAPAEPATATPEPRPARRSAPYRPPSRPPPDAPPTTILRVDDDTIAFGAPADETFLLLLEAAHDIGEVTYVDRSVPILEAICQFVGTPTVSLVITLQGRNDGTEAFCTVESIEARPGPPAKQVVDVLMELLAQRQHRRAQR
jgi:hypothetical protein